MNQQEPKPIHECKNEIHCNVIFIMRYDKSFERIYYESVNDS